MKQELQDFIDQWQFDCAINCDTLVFSDKRIDELLLPNRLLTHIVRKASFIKRLDFSSCPVAPQNLNDFPFLEEIILPDYIKVLPTIKNCPRLIRIKCKTHELTPTAYPCVVYVDQTSIKFSEKLRKIPSNLHSFQEIDLSDCTNLTINDHDLQWCNADTIILPSHIDKLPSCALNGCKKLRNVYGGNVKSLYYGALTDCPSLERIQFSKELNEQEIFWLTKRLKRDSLRLGRCGYVLASDEKYSYIWAFNVRKFYYAPKDSQREGSFVTFNHPMRETITIQDGMCKISRDNEWFVESLEEKLYSDVLWSPYQGFSEYRKESSTIYGYYANVQAEAIKTYLNLQDRLKKSIIDVINEINQKVDSLDISSIINSYHTSRETEVHNKIGGDVREEFYIRRGSFYNDGYLETLLPTYYDYSISIGYGYTVYNPNLQKEIEDDKKIDEHTRNNATNIYNKEEHKRFLINEYVQNIQKDAIFTERCLNIEAARKMLNDLKCLTGLHKVTALNQSIQI